MTAGPRFPRLDDWLEWQQSLHPNPIDLGLDTMVHGVAYEMYHCFVECVDDRCGCRGLGAVHDDRGCLPELRRHPVRGLLCLPKYTRKTEKLRG